MLGSQTLEIADKRHGTSRVPGLFVIQKGLFRFSALNLSVLDAWE